MDSTLTRRRSWAHTELQRSWIVPVDRLPQHRRALSWLKFCSIGKAFGQGYDLRMHDVDNPKGPGINARYAAGRTEA